MKVILVRHGEAENGGGLNPDSGRSLTQKGSADIEKIGRFIRASHLKVTQVFHSPYLRTRLTAEILSNEIGFEGEPISSSELSAGATCNDFLTCLASFSNSDTILLVGHNPDITQFAAKLLGNHQFSENIVFQPGSSMAINVAREKFDQGQILWAISPDLIDM